MNIVIDDYFTALLVIQVLPLLCCQASQSVPLPAIISSASADSSADSPRGRKAFCFSLDPPRRALSGEPQRMQDD